MQKGMADQKSRSLTNFALKSQSSVGLGVNTKVSASKQEASSIV